ncbi:MAG: hypothetical protein R2864_10755 [Syntrophotaleaceae bacterium]
MNRILLSLGIVLILSNSAATTAGNTKAEKRQAILNMKNDVLTDLYKVKPDVRSQISKAPGYAVFSNANVYIIFASVGGGHGVVINNRTGK